MGIERHIEERKRVEGGGTDSGLSNGLITKIRWLREVPAAASARHEWSGAKKGTDGCSVPEGMGGEQKGVGGVARRALLAGDAQGVLVGALQPARRGEYILPLRQLLWGRILREVAQGDGNRAAGGGGR